MGRAACSPAFAALECDSRPDLLAAQLILHRMGAACGRPKTSRPVPHSSPRACNRQTCALPTPAPRRCGWWPRSTRPQAYARALGSTRPYAPAPVTDTRWVATAMLVDDSHACYNGVAALQEEGRPSIVALYRVSRAPSCLTCSRQTQADVTPPPHCCHRRSLAPAPQRMARRPAMALLHLGAGLGNGLCNMHNARRARTPMVVRALLDDRDAWPRARPPLTRSSCPSKAASRRRSTRAKLSRAL